MNGRWLIAAFTALLSAVSWSYRFVDEYSRVEELALYILVPAACWIFFAAPLCLLGHPRKLVRVIGGTLLIPTSLLWLLSVLVGFYGLDIH